MQKPGQIYTNIRIRFRHPTESWILMEGSIVNLLHLKGVEALVINSRSIHEVKKLQDSLKEHQYKLEGIIDNSPAGIYMKDRQGHYMILNDAWQEILNLPKEDILGKTDFEILPPKQASIITHNDEKVMKSGQIMKLQESVSYPDGSERYFLTNKFSLLNAENEVMGICGVSNEVTELKNTQFALEKSESWFKAIVQNSLDFVTVVDNDGIKKYVTPSVKKILGFSPAEYLDINFFDNIHPDHELNLISSFKELINKKSKRRIKIYSKIKNSKINGFGSNIFLVINFKTSI
ncbi:PAS domain-containing protein [Candidatus Gracilibacteria bacterium]|nr:PAS domain-containing protein [Candidatus Gracilibacteria bacterium]